ncbi:uncharacterized protein VTP21DRAFT_726 [Calcarisporiella thermophila]|uniref:uncharacterized protein n=1 Tax=Calcarisporiella thermophila TaxID=911321 RepID=UPI0037445C59
MTLAGKIAIITGSSRGLGKAIALRFAREGAAGVIVNYLSNGKGAENTVAEINKLGGKGLAVQADVGKISDLKRLVDETVKQFGRIDILVNNAGIGRPNELSNITEQEFDQLFQTNVKGPVFLTKYAAPHIPTGGRVIFISSVLTVVNQPVLGFLLYTATKGAIEQITRILSKDLGRKGITVNAVRPGAILTDMNASLPQESIAILIESSPFNRMGEPEDIADVVYLVASSDSRWISGQMLTCDGAIAV